MFGSELSEGVWVHGLLVSTPEPQGYRGQFAPILPNWGKGVLRKGEKISIYNLVKILLGKKKICAHQRLQRLSVYLFILS